MAAMFDSEGNSWVYGPMHSGESDDLSCLAVATGQEESKAKRGYSVAILAGSITGAFVVGAVGASLVMWCLSRKTGPMMVSGSIYNTLTSGLTLDYSLLQPKISTQTHVLLHHIVPLPAPSLVNPSTPTLPWTLTHPRLSTILIYQALMALTPSPKQAQT